MSRRPAILLAAASLLCFLPVSLHLGGPVLGGSVVRAAQEPEYHPVTPATTKASENKAPEKKPAPRPRMDSHTALGLGRVPDAVAAGRGEPLYNQNCQACHGEGARGGIGPNLVRSVLVLHDDSGEAITQVIHSGRPQSGMPPFPQITDAQAHDISEYLHHQIELAANRGLYVNASTMASGDAGRGKTFFAAHCASCHAVPGDLAGVGAKYTDPPTLMTRILWPLPKTPRKATVTTADGKKLQGTLEHYDDFTTTLKLADGGSQSWETATVKVDSPDPIAGHTALLPVYSDDDLHDLTRYLMTLK